MGNENIKRALFILITFGLAVKKNLEDGFQPVQDILGLLPASVNLAELPTILPKFVEEIQDVDLTEQADIVKFVEETWQVGPNGAKKLIQLGANAAVAVTAFGFELRSVVSKGTTTQG